MLLVRFIRQYRPGTPLHGASAKTIPDGGVFYKSDDMGRPDKDGFLYIFDRSKNMITTGGFKIYAVEL